MSSSWTDGKAHHRRAPRSVTLPRRLRRVVAVLLLAGASVLSVAGTASAHAELIGSDPVAGEVLPAAPTRVTLTFGERVEVASTAVEVFDDRLRPVSVGPVGAVDADGTRLRVALPAGLPRGTYTVSWHVSSADTHPVSGSFRFSVGAPTVVTGALPGAGRNDVAGFLLGVLRGAAYIGLALGPGLLLVVLALWRAGLGDRRTRILLVSGVGFLALSTLGGMLLQGLWASGQPFSAIWSAPGTLDTHSRKFDQLYAVRFFLLVAFAALLLALLNGRPKPTVSRASGRRATRTLATVGSASPRANPQPSRSGVKDPRPPLPTRPPVTGWRTIAGAATISVGLLVTWALAGHAAAGEQTALAVTANVTHLVAMTLWLGGLAMLAVSLRPANRAADLAVVLPRFSPLAFTAVVVLVGTGTYLALREVGSVQALTSTEYGRVLLVKLLGVAAVLALGNLSRRWVQRHLAITTQSRLPLGAAAVAAGGPMTTRPAGYGDTELRRLRRGIVAELGIATAILGLTAALVVIVPARQAFARPFHRDISTAGLQVLLDIAAPRVGDSVLQVSVRSADGTPAPVTALHGSVELSSPRIGPLPVRVTGGGASPSGSQDVRLTLPQPGAWTLRLSIQTSPVDATALSATVVVP